MSSNDNSGGTFSEPPVLECEPERLDDLHSLDILDTAFEDRFDRFTELLASLYDFPVCLVSLVDENRQWFKSAHGLDFRETKRDRSFCAHALAQSEVFVIPDTSKDPRFAENPLVIGEPYVRFYAGAVIHGPHGLPLGTLCLLDRKPRDFDERDRKHLRQFADLVENELQYNYQFREIRLAERYAAHTDVLTELPNRRLFEDRLQQFVHVARTRNDASFTVLHIDVVDFLRVNRTLGREAGDAVLQELAERLRGLCPAGGTVARLYGDRFAMVMPKARYASDGPDALVCRLAHELARPVHIGDREQFLQLRIGASVYHDARDSAEILLERAAAAARFAGSPLEHGVNVHFYDHRMETELKRQFELETRLRGALEHDQFHLVYQPVFDITGEQIVSLEALLRWEEPTLGNISPGEFIPLAEATGLILPMGNWVLSEALRQYGAWRDEGLKPVPVQVNLSARELEQPGFSDQLTSLLKKSDVPEDALCLEITETVLIQNIEANATVMKKLTEGGVKFYIDDFGKGYSSLQYLRRLPFAALKIDRSFVSDVNDDPDDAAIAQSVIALGKTLGVTVIAEGVETKDQLDFLQDAGCHMAQGFYLAKPMKADDVSSFIRG